MLVFTKYKIINYVKLKSKVQNKEMIMRERERCARHILRRNAKRIYRVVDDIVYLDKISHNY